MIYIIIGWLINEVLIFISEAFRYDKVPREVKLKSTLSEEQRHFVHSWFTGVLMRVLVWSGVIGFMYG